MESARFTTQGVSQAIPHHSGFVQNRKGGNLRQIQIILAAEYEVETEGTFCSSVRPAVTEGDGRANGSLKEGM